MLVGMMKSTYSMPFLFIVPPARQSQCAILRWRTNVPAQFLQNLDLIVRIYLQIQTSGKPRSRRSTAAGVESHDDCFDWEKTERNHTMSAAICRGQFLAGL
jgi:hypothetical protein